VPLLVSQLPPNLHEKYLAVTNEAPLTKSWRYNLEKLLRKKYHCYAKRFGVFMVVTVKAPAFFWDDRKCT
jgi:hypothetical protein